MTKFYTSDLPHRRAAVNRDAVLTFAKYGFIASIPAGLLYYAGLGAVVVIMLCVWVAVVMGCTMLYVWLNTPAPTTPPKKATTKLTPVYTNGSHTHNLESREGG